HIARGQAFLEHAREVVAGSDLVRIEEDTLVAELALQPVEQTPGVRAGVVAPVTDEDGGPAQRHRSGPQATSTVLKTASPTRERRVSVERRAAGQRRRMSWSKSAKTVFGEPSKPSNAESALPKRSSA